MDSHSQKTRKCKTCKHIKPVTEFDTNASGRSKKSCKPCAARITAAKAKSWDYFSALHKHITMSAHMLKESVYGSLTVKELREIAKRQGYACALTRRELYIPLINSKEGVTKYGVRCTIKKVIRQIDPERLRNSVPIPVKINRMGDWEPANVMFVLKIIADFYNSCDSMYEFKTLCESAAHANIERL